jgi:hypothetical protein
LKLLLVFEKERSHTWVLKILLIFISFLIFQIFRNFPNTLQMMPKLLPTTQFLIILFLILYQGPNKIQNRDKALTGSFPLFIFYKATRNQMFNDNRILLWSSWCFMCCCIKGSFHCIDGYSGITTVVDTGPSETDKF